MQLPTEGSRRVRRALVAVFAVSAAALTMGSASSRARADGAYTVEAGETEEHGSQSASSEWLPIVLGAAGGVAIGAFVGPAVDDHQPAVLGPIFGAAIGGVAGGGAGSWFIRGVRDLDTRASGTVTFAALGLGLGAVFYSKTDYWYEGVPALVILPILGGFVGRKLAMEWASPKKSGEAATTARGAIVPTATPIVARDRGVTGLSLGVSGAF